MVAEMSHRQRVRAALNHQEPDRVPIDLGSTAVTSLTMKAHRNLQSHLRLAPKEPVLVSRMFQVAKVDEDILRHFDVDFRAVFYRTYEENEGIVFNSDRYINEWGVTLYRPKEGLYYDIVDSPLAEAEIEDLESYHWPDPLNPYRFDGLDREAEDLYETTDYALVGPGTDASFFEDSWMLRGFERFLMDLLDNPEFIHMLLGKVLDIRKAMMGRYLELVGRYLDVVYVADDLAIQTGPLVSLDMYRTMIKPYQREYFHFIKERTQAKLFYHCCGNVLPLLEDFIEIGVDIINPVQVSAQDMDTKVLKEKFGDRICFWGGIDTQHVLPRGSQEEVREEVRRRIGNLAPGGGYVLAPVHNVQPDVPPENLCAMYHEAVLLGRYAGRL